MVVTVKALCLTEFNSILIATFGLLDVHILTHSNNNHGENQM